MGRMKDFAMQVSIDMGLGGDLTPEVLAEADRRMNEDYRRTWAEKDPKWDESLARQAESEEKEELVLQFGEPCYD